MKTPGFTVKKGLRGTPFTAITAVSAGMAPLNVLQPKPLPTTTPVGIEPKPKSTFWTSVGNGITDLFSAIPKPINPNISNDQNVYIDPNAYKTPETEKDNTIWYIAGAGLLAIAVIAVVAKNKKDAKKD